MLLDLQDGLFMLESNLMLGVDKKQEKAENDVFHEEEETYHISFERRGEKVFSKKVTVLRTEDVSEKQDFTDFTVTGFKREEVRFPVKQTLFGGETFGF